MRYRLIHKLLKLIIIGSGRRRIYIYKDAAMTGKFTIQGNTRIIPSSDNEKGHNDVFLLTADNYITLSGELTGENPAARITVPDANYQTSTKGLDGTMELINSEHDKFTVTPKDLGGGSTQQWEVTATLQISLSLPLLLG